MQVTVLGAGIAGLTTTARLLAAGCGVQVVAAAPIEASTSYLAAAVWFPTHVGPADRVSDWGRRTYDVLAEQAARGIPGVVMRESLALYREPPAKPDWADAVRGVRAATAAELPQGYQYGLRFVVPLVEMPLYLPWLAKRVRADGAELYRRRIHSLGELVEDGVDAIVNCSGLAARELVGDESVYPVRGQIARVTNPGLTMSVRDARAFLGHPSQHGHRPIDPPALPRRRPGAGGSDRHRARGRLAPRPPDGPPGRGHPRRAGSTHTAQLRARRCGHHNQLGLCGRGCFAARAVGELIPRMLAE
jgi:D-amino-acid oxidase